MNGKTNPLPPAAPRDRQLPTNDDWRFERPVWDTAKCVRCGICYLVCPDSAIAQNAENFFDADLRLCKGCGLCAEQCITGSISLEAEGSRPPWLAKY